MKNVKQLQFANCKLILLFIFLLLPAIVFSQGFIINGTKIMQPNGTEFVPIGANIAGWNYHDWSHNAVSQASIIENSWKFNVLRANIYLKSTSWNGVLTNGGKTWRNNMVECTAALDLLVSTFTAKKIVIMLEVHDWTCTYPTTVEDKQLLSDFWNWASNHYKNNSYVWFNIMNEPQWITGNGNASYDWVLTHRPIIALIRDQNLANNIIIIDGVNCGQETQTWSNGPIPASQSAVITYGNDVKNFNNKTYNNIGFNFHMYGFWGLDNTQSDTKLNDFITRVHSLGHCIFVGEVGATGLGDTHQVQNAVSAYRVALLSKRVGMLAWHWDPKDGYRLTESGSGAAINSLTNPTNLTSWCGKYFWDATHIDGFGLSNPITVTSDTISPTTPTNLTATNITSNSVTLSWTASSDNIGVTGYQVYSGTTLLTTTTSLNFIVTGLVRATRYSFSIRAKDLANNLSLASNVLTVTTSRKVGARIAGDEIDNNGSESILAYPNPNEGQLYIDYFSANDQTINIQLINMLGAKLFTENIKVSKGNNTIPLNTEKCSSGSYLVCVTSDSSTLNTKIIIK